MATCRQVVSVYKFNDPANKTETIPLPSVMQAPLRPDIVRFVNRNISLNSRQPWAQKFASGRGYAAESWGTGRAVARIPRIPGGGTHRAGQGAFGNMCRGAGHFNPTHLWKRWTRRTNKKIRRHAVVSAIAATGVPPLVMARGHKIDQVPELPLVVTDGFESIRKTKTAFDVLKGLGAGPDMQRVINTKTLRAGKGKRIAKYNVRRGPLIVYKEDNGIMKAVRNLPGVDTANVNSLCLFELAPGAALGRFTIWTQSAFEHLQKMYGTKESGAPLKKNFNILQPCLKNADLARIINSKEVQSVLRQKKDAPVPHMRKINPLKNRWLMDRLNPIAKEVREKLKAQNKKGTPEHAAMVEGVKKRKSLKRQTLNQQRKTKTVFLRRVMKAFNVKKAEPEEDAASEE